MSRKRQTIELEDVTHLAGWMYADLLLALMVIFLATISFVPKLAAASSGITQSSSSQNDLGRNYKLGLALVYTNFDEAKVREDIRIFKINEGLASDSQILYAQITGGYLSGSETTETGRVRALEFSLKLRKNLPDIFANAPAYLSASSNLKTGEVALRITFTQKIN